MKNGARLRCGETDETPLPEGEDDGLGDLAYDKLQIHGKFLMIPTREVI